MKKKFVSLQKKQQKEFINSLLFLLLHFKVYNDAVAAVTAELKINEASFVRAT